MTRWTDVPEPKQYSPISCASHSEIELAIMRRQRLRLGWCIPGEDMQVLECLPMDILSQSGEEFLIVEDTAGLRHRLRWIISVS